MSNQHWAIAIALSSGVGAWTFGLSATWTTPRARQTSGNFVPRFDRPRSAVSGSQPRPRISAIQSSSRVPDR